MGPGATGGAALDLGDDIDQGRASGMMSAMDGCPGGISAVGQDSHPARARMKAAAAALSLGGQVD